MILRYARYPSGYGDGNSTASEDVLKGDRAHLREILALLRMRTNHDFTGYRQATMLRRIQRRMGIVDAHTLADYAETLRNTSNEVGALANDLMINVTGFFRDPEGWDSSARGGEPGGAGHRAQRSGSHASGGRLCTPLGAEAAGERGPRVGTG